MATYAIGDVQGCFTTLSQLLTRIDFRPAKDRLWLVGDLVNRGPDSLAVLRWARSLGESLVTVLGNHDLHLLARAEGLRRPRKRDTLDAVLAAEDRDVLIEWLASRPLLFREGDYLVVHAGLPPGLSLPEVEELAAEAGRKLASPAERGALLESLYKGSRVPPLSPELRPMDRLRGCLDALTRIRTVAPNGAMCMEFSGPPKEAPPGCRPWFDLLSKRVPKTIVFGHWARLGLYLEDRFIGLDTGCVWGGRLTAVRLEDRAVFQEPSELA